MLDVLDLAAESRGDAAAYGARARLVGEPMTADPMAADDRGAAAQHRSRPAVESSAQPVCDLAMEALHREVLLTPKPGLVDQRNSGAHRDMTLATFMASGEAIRPWFPLFFATGARTALLAPTDVLSELRAHGLECERAMFYATQGVNTHKGAIFSFGLLVAAAGRRFALGNVAGPDELCADVASMTAGVVECELNASPRANTAGETVFRRHGLTGARGEAASGFATVRGCALPAFRTAWRRTGDERLSLSAALVALLARNPDTNLVARGGMSGLAYVQACARKLLDRGGVEAPDFFEAMMRFDDDLIERNLSPGGSADLLAVTWFLARLPVVRHQYSSVYPRN
jgi:triphosphoribosyl-dephospho-CoA synthase